MDWQQARLARQSSAGGLQIKPKSADYQAKCKGGCSLSCSFSSRSALLELLLGRRTLAEWPHKKKGPIICPNRTLSKLEQFFPLNSTTRAANCPPDASSPPLQASSQLLSSLSLGPTSFQSANRPAGAAPELWIGANRAGQLDTRAGGRRAAEKERWKNKQTDYNWLADNNWAAITSELVVVAQFFLPLQRRARRAERACLRAKLLAGHSKTAAHSQLASGANWAAVLKPAAGRLEYLRKYLDLRPWASIECSYQQCKHRHQSSVPMSV